MYQALSRQKTEDIHVVPIVLRPVHWKNTPLGGLQVLPTDGKAVTTWRRRDEAYWNIVDGISKIVTPLLAQRQTDEGHKYFFAKQYEQALAAYDKAIHIEPSCAETYYWEGNVLFAIKQYDEARIDYEQAISLAPDEADFYYAKAVTLVYLDCYEEALIMAEKATQLYPEFVDAYNCKGNILLYLDRTEEAFDTFMKAEQIKQESDRKPLHELLDDAGF